VRGFDERLFANDSGSQSDYEQSADGFAISAAAIEIGAEFEDDTDEPSKTERDISGLGELSITIPEDREDFEATEDGVFNLEQKDELIGSDGGALAEKAMVQPAAAALDSEGALTPPEGSDPSRREAEEDTSPAIVVSVSGTHVVFVHTKHPLGSAVNEVAERIVDDRGEFILADVPQFENRQYLTDSTEDPELFVKVTHPPTDRRYEGTPTDPRCAQNEMDIAPAVSRIIGSEAAQAVAREQGYTGIDYVAPVAAARNRHTGVETVAYLWQEGRSVLDLTTVEAQAEWGRIEAVGSGLYDVFQANCVWSDDLRVDQILLDEDHKLHLLDAEMYKHFDPGSPKFAPGQIVRYRQDQWSAEFVPDSLEQAASTILLAEPGISIAGRRNDGENPVFCATSDQGCVVSLTNSFTGESALIHMPAPNVRIAEGERAIDHMVSALPSLHTRGAIAHIITGGSQLHTLVRGCFARHLALYGVINIKEVITEPGKTVWLHSGTGKVEVSNREGKRIYAYQPLPGQSRPHTAFNV
jgi:hypothetical protein